MKIRAGIASPGLAKSGHTPKVPLVPWIARFHQSFVRTRTGGEAFDTRIEAFVLGMNETGLTAARCLGREGITVRGFDTSAERPAFRSRYCRGEVCPDPLHEPDDLVRFLRDQVRAGSQ